MGHQNYVSVLLRLTGAELYKLRRRTMSKVLGITAICIILLGMAISGIQAMIAFSTPAGSYLTPDHAATQADLQGAAAAKQAGLYLVSSPLRLPESFITSSRIIQGMGFIILIILAGTIVGGEYGAGTIRLLYTRGPTRTQFLLAKTLCLVTCAVGGSIILALLGVATGALLSFIMGQPANFGFLTGEHLLHLTAYLGVITLGSLIYALIALFLSTLGKNAAAGLTGALIWWILENALGGIFVLLSHLATGPVSTILRAVPDYFVGNNIVVLLADQAHYLESGSAGAGDSLHAILVLLAYVIVLLGGACLINARRDVVN
jgi:ABC-type transport system involved in multi-copper enzyme maturation permease subunit